MKQHEYLKFQKSCFRLSENLFIYFYVNVHIYVYIYTFTFVFVFIYKVVILKMAIAETSIRHDGLLCDYLLK